MLISFLALHSTLKEYAEREYCSLTPRKGSATVRGRTIHQSRRHLTRRPPHPLFSLNIAQLGLVVTGVPAFRRIKYCCVTRGYYVTRAIGTTHDTHSHRRPRTTLTTTHQAAEAHAQSTDPGLANQEAEGIASPGAVADIAVVLDTILVADAAHTQ